MLYFISDASKPVEYISCGNLASSNGFMHPKRNIDSFVLIIVIKGTLHITQNVTNYDVRENDFILLFPNTSHYGYRQTDGELSYYWVHFYVKDPDYSIYSRGSLLRNRPIFKESTDITSTPPRENFLLPEYGELSVEKRSRLLFVQLLDIAKRENYMPTWRCHYALNLLLMEVTNESFQINSFLDSNVPVHVLDVIEWIRTHYDQPLTVASIAEQFGYHPTYLTNIFKKYTGYPILTYVNRTRIAVAKNLLTNRTLSIYRIADMCGFLDEKYFMKLFKRYEGITPTQYRKAFHQKKINLS